MKIIPYDFNNEDFETFYPADLKHPKLGEVVKLRDWDRKEQIECRVIGLRYFRHSRADLIVTCEPVEGKPVQQLDDRGRPFI